MNLRCSGISAHWFYAQFPDKDQQPSGSEGEDDDVEAALKKEVGDIKASTEMRLRRFQSVESGANNVVFIRTLGIGMSDIRLEVIDPSQNPADQTAPCYGSVHQLMTPSLHCVSARQMDRGNGVVDVALAQEWKLGFATFLACNFW